MKAICRLVVSLLVSAVVVLMAAPSLHAQTLSNLAGTWNNGYFSTPSRLTLEKDAQQRVVNVPERSLFKIGSDVLTVQSNGTFSMAGGGSGVLSIGAQGVVDAIPNGDTAVSFRVNAAEDVMIAATRSPAPSTSHDLNFLVKAPSSIVSEDVAGTWSLCFFDTPAAISQILGGEFNVVQNISPTQGFQSFSGYMTINADGTLSGVAGGAFSGTWSYAGSGRVNALIDGVFSLTFFINASKDVMVNVNEQISATDNTQEAIMMVKVPASVTTAELAGAWKVNQIGTPSILDAQYNLNGELVSLGGRDNFEVAQEYIVIGNDGYLTGHIPGPATGSATPGANGVIDVSISMAGEPVQNIAFRINAAKNTMVITTSGGGTQELLMLTKAPVMPGVVDFGMHYTADAGFLTFHWAANSGRVLQYSEDLIHWFDIPVTNGAHDYSASMAGPPDKFYRILEPVVP